MGSAGDKSTVLVAISMEEEEAELEGDSTIYILRYKVEFKARDKVCRFQRPFDVMTSTNSSSHGGAERKRGRERVISVPGCVQRRNVYRKTEDVHAWMDSPSPPRLSLPDPFFASPALQFQAMGEEGKLTFLSFQSPN